jgi:hypothetical protein
VNAGRNERLSDVHAPAHTRSARLPIVEPVTTRLRDAGAPHPGITADDIAMFIRMTVAETITPDVPRR